MERQLGALGPLPHAGRGGGSLCHGLSTLCSQEISEPRARPRGLPGPQPSLGQSHHGAGGQATGTRHWLDTPLSPAIAGPALETVSILWAVLCSLQACTELAGTASVSLTPWHVMVSSIFPSLSDSMIPSFPGFSGISFRGIFPYVHRRTSAPQRQSNARGTRGSSCLGLVLGLWGRDWSCQLKNQ